MALPINLQTLLATGPTCRPSSPQTLDPLLLLLLPARYLAKCGRQRVVDRMRQAAASNDDEQLDAWLRDYGRDIIGAVRGGGHG